MSYVNVTLADPVIVVLYLVGVLAPKLIPRIRAKKTVKAWPMFGLAFLGAAGLSVCRVVELPGPLGTTARIVGAAMALVAPAFLSEREVKLGYVGEARLLLNTQVRSTNRVSILAFSGIIAISEFIPRVPPRDAWPLLQFLATAALALLPGWIMSTLPKVSGRQEAQDPFGRSLAVASLLVAYAAMSLAALGALSVARDALLKAQHPALPATQLLGPLILLAAGGLRAVSHGKLRSLRRLSSLMLIASILCSVVSTLGKPDWRTVIATALVMYAVFSVVEYSIRLHLAGIDLIMRNVLRLSALALTATVYSTLMKTASVLDDARPFGSVVASSLGDEFALPTVAFAGFVLFQVGALRGAQSVTSMHPACVFGEDVGLSWYSLIFGVFLPFQFVFLQNAQLSLLQMIALLLGVVLSIVSIPILVTGSFTRTLQELQRPTPRLGPSSQVHVSHALEVKSISQSVHLLLPLAVGWGALLIASARLELTIS